MVITAQVGGSPPIPRTRLIGRETERATARAFLVEHAVPLLTLTGAGGVGKTRLALAVTEDVAQHYADGVVWIDLAPLTDPGLLPKTTAEAISLAEAAERSITDTLLHTLHTKQALLVFDNCEHLLDAVAPFVTTLLSHCLSLQILITSRVRLGLSHEQVFRVAPLDLPALLPNGHVPDLSTIGQCAAVQLFVARAQAVESTFALAPGNATVVSEICQRLDGLPLALELAAARIRHLAPAQLLARLSPLMPLLMDGPRDQPQRLRTMRDAIAWSYDLLPSHDQAIFRSLAVFVGGFTLEAAEAVITLQTDVPGDADEVLASISRLLDQNLLYRTEAETARFGMLETIREFASEELQAHGGEDAMRGAHAAYYRALAERGDPELPEDSRPVLLDLHLHPDLGNVRAAMTWFTAQGRGQDALRLAASASWAWRMHGHYQEAIAWLQRALAMDSDASPAVRCHAMQRLSALACDFGEFVLANTVALENLTYARAHHDDLGIGRALLNLGVQAGLQGDHARDGKLNQEALASFRAAGHPYAIVHALSNLADWAYAHRDYAQAQEWCTEAVTIARSLGHPYFIVSCVSVEAQLALESRDVAKASALFLETAMHSLRLRDDLNVAASLSGLAGVALLRRDPETATRWLATAQATLTHIGAVTIYGDEQFSRAKSAARAMVSQSQHDAAWAEGWQTPLRTALAAAMAVAAAWQAEDDPPSATTPAAARGLSPREVDVLRLLIAGRSDPEIAEMLWIGRRTAQSHVSSILKKLQVSNRTEAASVAVRDHLI